MREIPNSIKEMLINDRAVFNVRVSFPNGEREDICNNMIVNGSLKFTETLCSQDVLKFGLCESPQIEFETVGVGNIKNKTIVVVYEVICSADVEGAEWRADIQKHVYTIPVGRFIVSECERQADMQHRRVVAYGGGSAVNWKMPNFEILKSETAGTTGYDVDILKIIATLFDMPTTELETLGMEAYKSEFSAIDAGTIYRYEFGLLRRTSPTFGQLPRGSIIKADFETIPTYKIVSAFDELRADIERLNPREDISERLSWLLSSTKRDAPYLLTMGNRSGHVIEKNKAIYIEPNYLYSTWYQTVISSTYSFYLKDTNRGTYKYYIFNDTFKAYLCETDLAGRMYRVTSANRDEFLNLDLREYLESELELTGKIARVNRENRLEIIDIKNQYLLKPSEELTPSEGLKPRGVIGGSIDKYMYSSLWYQENYSLPFGAVYCKYRNTDNEDAEERIYLEGFNDETDLATYQVYDITDNSNIKNTTHTQAEIIAILQNIAEAVEGVSYVPVELDAVALPYIEPGDTLEVLTENNDSISCIVFRRTLSGESYIKDYFTNK